MQCTAAVLTRYDLVARTHSCRRRSWAEARPGSLCVGKVPDTEVWCVAAVLTRWTWDGAQTFLQAEELGESETWYCGRCKAHVQAQKKLDLWRLPELLVVLIKRFEHTRSGRVKLDAPVAFPLRDLDLSPYLAHAQARPALFPVYGLQHCIRRLQQLQVPRMH